MIECTECGFRNEDDDHFCGGCQEPLEWTGRRIDEVEEDVAEEDPATDERSGLVERVLDRLDKRGVEDPGPTEAQVEVEPQQAEQDVASTVTAEAVARAEREVEEAVRAQSEAEQRAQEQAAAAEEARVRAEEARAARERAEQSVQQETEEAARVREELEAARAARQEAEEELERESEAAADARRRADEFGDEQRRHEAVEAELQQEREAIERAQAELEQAEAARREAEERARVEAEAAEEAAQAAAAAEEARAAAEAKAREEAAAAEQARRAAALVARPKPEPPDEDDTTRSSTSGRRPEKKGSRKQGRQKKGRRGEDRTSGVSGPGPREPDRPKIRKGGPQRKQKPSRRLRPGDRICGQCGEGNIPTRNYCRRCGKELHEAEVVRRPWWKRWIPRRRPRVYKAGERPDRAGRSTGGSGGGTGGVKGAVRGAQGLRRRIMGPIGKVARVLAVVVVAAGAAGLAFNPDLRSRVTEPATDAFEWVRQRIAPQLARVNPVAVEASSARADTADGFCCAADNVEEFGNTWWHASEGGVGQFLVLTLDTPTTITDFGIIPGAGDDAVWADHPRPRDLEVDFLNDQGRTVATVDITDINDDHGDEAQVFDIDGAEDVTSVRVTVTRVYGENLDSDDVAISEIRLWTRR